MHAVSVQRSRALTAALLAALTISACDDSNSARSSTAQDFFVLEARTFLLGGSVPAKAYRHGADGQDVQPAAIAVITEDSGLGLLQYADFEPASQRNFSIVQSEQNLAGPNDRGQTIRIQTFLGLPNTRLRFQPELFFEDSDGCQPGSVALSVNGLPGGADVVLASSLFERLTRLTPDTADSVQFDAVQLCPQSPLSGERSIFVVAGPEPLSDADKLDFSRLRYGLATLPAEAPAEQTQLTLDRGYSARRLQIVNIDFIVTKLIAQFIAAAMDDTAFDACSCKPCAVHA